MLVLYIVCAFENANTIWGVQGESKDTVPLNFELGFKS